MHVSVFLNMYVYICVYMCVICISNFLFLMNTIFNTFSAFIIGMMDTLEETNNLAWCHKTYEFKLHFSLNSIFYGASSKSSLKVQRPSESLINSRSHHQLTASFLCLMNSFHFRNMQSHHLSACPYS